MKDLYLLRKKIIVEKSKIIYDKPFTENYLDDWKIMAGEWKYEDGCLIGREEGNKGGILLYKEFFDKPVMMTFTASTVLPATRDVNAVFCANWDEDINDLGDSYVCGINGWYDNKAGLERNLKGGGLAFRALSQTSCKYSPGTDVTMTVGAIDGHIFMFVNGKLVAENIEYKDYLTSGYIGFSPFCTILKIKKAEIREIYYESFKQDYDPEF